MNTLADAQVGVVAAVMQNCSVTPSTRMITHCLHYDRPCAWFTSVVPKLPKKKNPTDDPLKKNIVTKVFNGNLSLLFINTYTMYRYKLKKILKKLMVFYTLKFHESMIIHVALITDHLLRHRTYIYAFSRNTNH